MTLVRRKLFALSIILPTLAVGAFALAPPVQADCTVGASQCCYNGNSFSLGSCLNVGGCWWFYSKCDQGPGDAYWGACDC